MFAKGHFLKKMLKRISSHEDQTSMIARIVETEGTNRFMIQSSTNRTIWKDSTTKIRNIWNLQLSVPQSKILARAWRADLQSLSRSPSNLWRQFLLISFFTLFRCGYGAEFLPPVETDFFLRCCHCTLDGARLGHKQNGANKDLVDLAESNRLADCRDSAFLLEPRY